QDFKKGKKRAIGLASVQANDHPGVSPKRLADPYVNLSLTAREFRQHWKTHDMASTVMDVWYPGWRARMAKKRSLPAVGSPKVYLQAIANRYQALRLIDGRLAAAPGARAL